jgi:hypothetical protein
MNRSKWVSIVVVAALLAGSSLVPLTANAQMQPPPPPPGSPPPPPPVFVTGPYQPTRGDRVGAGFLNVVYVPGKAILCSFGAVASAGLMLLTFGNAYHASVELFNEGCGGKWVLSPYDVAAKRPPEEGY